MNLQYGKAFQLPRKAFKILLSAAYPLIIRLYPLPKVASIEDTIDKIIKDKVSICRFGDGELMYMSEKRSLPFQVQDESLRQRFEQILKSNNEKILVGLPIGYYSLTNLKPDTKRAWRAIISWTYPSIRKYLQKDKLYYNASMTRLYMDYEDTRGSGVLFEKVMQIWQNREILLLEGEKSRLGAGNNLFQNAKSVQRILAPANNAYAKFDDLFQEVLNYDTNKLILVAMGPTAKSLCYELALKGYQAIDIGNLDVEYEWYLRGATSKIKIPGKYTSEAIGGRIVEDLNDEKYQAQIIKKIL
jgi:glycosyltransferase family protein